MSLPYKRYWLGMVTLSTQTPQKIFLIGMRLKDGKLNLLQILKLLMKMMKVKMPQFREPNPANNQQLVCRVYLQIV